MLKHRILRKIRATFLSLSEEKKATSAGLKRLRRSRHPLAYSLGIKRFQICIKEMLISKSNFKYGFGIIAVPYKSSLSVRSMTHEEVVICLHNAHTSEDSYQTVQIHRLI